MEIYIESPLVGENNLNRISQLMDDVLKTLPNLIEQIENIKSLNTLDDGR
jgi:hypothetical protein